MKKYFTIPALALLFVFGFGFALADDDGTVTFTIASTTEVTFTTATVAFGSGYVNGTTAIVDSEGTTNGDGTWTAPSAGLVVENTGSANIELNLTADSDASTLIGGPSPAIMWKLTDTNSGCTEGTDLSSYASIATDNSTQACSVLTPSSEVALDFQLTIPDDAVAAGAKTLTVTAIATAA
jgi:hypothetical protein